MGDLIAEMKVSDAYEVKARFPLSGARFWILNAVGFLITILLWEGVTILAAVANPNLRATMESFNPPTMRVLFFVVLVCLAAVLLSAHEVIHYVCYRIFLRKEKGPRLSLNPKNPNVSLPTGVVCSRNQAIAGALAPLILALIGLVVWLSATSSVVSYFASFFLSASVGAAIADVTESFWLLRHPSHYLFGFDGVDSVLYGPPS